MPNCSTPEPPSLLAALTPVFSLNTIRPVYNLTTTTQVYIEFILFGILGVVRESDGPTFLSDYTFITLNAFHF